MTTSRPGAMPTPSSGSDTSPDSGAITAPTAIVNAKPNPSAPSLLSPTLRPTSTMTTPELTAEFTGLFKVTAVVISRLGEVYGELKRRGVAVTIPGVLLKTFIPKVAMGLVTAEAVAAFLDAPALMRAVSHLPPPEQRRLAAGGTIPVLPTLDAAPVEMTGLEIYENRCLHVFYSGRILDVDQQAGKLRSQAIRNQKNSTGRLKAMAGRGKVEKVPAATEKPRRATEAEVEALAARIEREARMRGSATVTPRQAAEMVQMFGWGPAG